MAVKASGQITIVDLTDGYSVLLTSEAYTFVGGTDGVAAGASCTTSAVALCGTNRCNNVTVNASAIVCPTGISATVSNSGSSEVTITFTTTAKVSNSCEATIPVSVDGITINKKFSFAVAKTGAQGNTGAAGKGIQSTVITYQKSSSGSTAPTGSWGSTIPTLSDGEYLWTRTVITYTDGSTTTSYSVGMRGQKGSQGNPGATGNGVSSTTVTYQKSSNGQNVPTGNWSNTIPTLSAGEYLWTKTVFNYTNGSSSSPSYSVSMKGANGAKGDQGNPGNDAITIVVLTSNGSVLKNNSGNTVLTAHAYKGGVELTIADNGTIANEGVIKWYKDGSSAATAAKSITVQASQITNTANYTCQLEG